MSEKFPKQINPEVQNLHETFNAAIEAGVAVQQAGNYGDKAITDIHEDALYPEGSRNARRYEIFTRPGLNEIKAEDDEGIAIVQRTPYATKNGGDAFSYAAVGINEVRGNGSQLNATSSDVAKVVEAHKSVNFSNETSSGPDPSFAKATDASAELHNSPRVVVGRKNNQGEFDYKELTGARAERVTGAIISRAAAKITGLSVSKPEHIQEDAA